MRIYVIRHAAAAPRGDYPRDRDRPLTEKGAARMSAVAAGLAKLAAAPWQVFTSPLLRARQTAEIVAAAMAGKAVLEECGKLASGCDPRDVVEFLARREFDEAAIVGHAPQLDEVVSLFLTGRTAPTVDMKKASVACVEFQTRVAAGEGTLAWHLVPEVVAALGGE